MKLIPAAIRLATAGALVGGMVATAGAAHATTTPRGTTNLMECDDVAIQAKINDPITKTGLNYTTHNIKVTGIKHPETIVPSIATKGEPDTSVTPGTPDLGETDSCSGLITTNANPWTTAGVIAPYGPVQGTYAAAINDITGVAGALTGRADCDTSTSNTSSWTLHGKLTVKLGNEATPGTTSTPQSLIGLVKVQSQVYVNSSQPVIAPVDLNADTDTLDAGETVSDYVVFQGIGVKGTAEGAFYDQSTTFRPLGFAGVGAAEACSFLIDLNADTIIGEAPAGGFQNVLTDTDVDSSIVTNDPLVGVQPAYNNSAIFSI